MKGFEVYICEMNNDIDQCVLQNVHNRTVEEITQVMFYCCINTLCTPFINMHLQYYCNTTA